MVHDFAKIKPEPILEYKAVESPPSWMLLFTGLVTGLAIGVFGSFLFYLSGYVPPLQPPVLANVTETPLPVTATTEPDNPETVADGTLELEFYKELQEYEVIVDATPVDIAAEPVEITGEPVELPVSSNGYMLQTGAYEQQSSADRQRNRLQAMGLDTVIKQQDVTGRILYLVQSGPFGSRDQVSSAESLLRRNNISSLRISLQ